MPVQPDDVLVSDFIQQRGMWHTLRKRVGALHEATNETIARYTRAILVPVTGNALQRLGTMGFEPDGFMGQVGSFRFATTANVQEIRIVGWLPAQHGSDVSFTISCGEHVAFGSSPPNSRFEFAVAANLGHEEEGEIRIALSSFFQPSVTDPPSPDTRCLGCLILAVKFS